MDLKKGQIAPHDGVLITSEEWIKLKKDSLILDQIDLRLKEVNLKI